MLPNIYNLINYRNLYQKFKKYQDTVIFNEKNQIATMDNILDFVGHINIQKIKDSEQKKALEFALQCFYLSHMWRLNNYEESSKKITQSIKESPAGFITNFSDFLTIHYSTEEIDFMKNLFPDESDKLVSLECLNLFAVTKNENIKHKRINIKHTELLSFVTNALSFVFNEVSTPLDEKVKLLKPIFEELVKEENQDVEVLQSSLFKIYRFGQSYFIEKGFKIEALDNNTPKNKDLIQKSIRIPFLFSVDQLLIEVDKKRPIRKNNRYELLNTYHILENSVYAQWCLDIETLYGE